MNTFVLTYAVVWSALILYVINLGLAQRRLSRAATRLQSQVLDPKDLSRTPLDERTV